VKLATWNVNSLRARLERALAWLASHKPDVVCLQELKCEEALLPTLELHALGYHGVYHCQKTYNGVAILSRTPISDVSIGFDDGDDDSQTRLIAGTIDGVRVLSAYFPNGQTVGSDKFLYKLKWMARLRAHLDKRYAASQPLVLCGDFNVAPEARDVHEPRQWENTVLFHPDARQALDRVRGFGFSDVFRRHHDEAGAYSWWDYRMLGFPKNRGLRIDHIYATEVLAARSTGSWIDREERKGKLPSDHAPVLATFEL
jgi:exodeoxyribonuclease III